VKPTITELRKIAASRFKQVQASEKGLLSKTNTLQRKLNAFMRQVFIPSLDIDNGRIKNTNANLLKIKKASKLRAFLKNVINLSLLDYYDKEFSKTQSNSIKYFNGFSPTQAATSRISTRGNTFVDTFLDSLFENNTVFSNLQTTLRNGATTGQRVSDLTQLMNDQITGKGKKFGLLTSYHYNNGFNEFQDYARDLDNQFSKELNLNYAIYAGGEIKTTRHFCDEHNGKIYTREEIEDLGQTEWQGKKDNNNIFIDAGGYNCRHNWDFISYQLAKRLRPNIERSKYDKI